MADPREILRTLEQRARRRFGQHFLTRPDVVVRIVRGAGILPGDRVVEVGPGLGMLTDELVGAGADVTAVELDRDLAAYLRESRPGLKLIEGDAGKMDLGALVGDGGLMVANLPYNVGTGIVADTLAGTTRLRSIVVMLQREVVLRMLAEPGSEHYGALSVRVAARAEGRVVLNVPPSAFHPPPKVDSTVIRLDPRPIADFGSAGAEAFDRTVKAAFAQRRKTIQNSLTSAFDRDCVVDALAAAGIAPTLRAETLPLSAFRDLAAALHPSAG